MGEFRIHGIAKPPSPPSSEHTDATSDSSGESDKSEVKAAVLDAEPIGAEPHPDGDHDSEHEMIALVPDDAEAIAVALPVPHLPDPVLDAKPLFDVGIEGVDVCNTKGNK